MLRLVFFAVIAIAMIVVDEGTARAQPPPQDLMARLGAYAERFESMRKRASYAVEGELDSVDSHGHASSTKKMKARVESNGHDTKFSILEYLEDGADKTAEARDKLQKSEAEKAKHPDPPKREWRMPFHPREQARYVFEIIAHDPNDPNHVRIAFVPKIREEDTIEGSAWVDVPSGTLISAGFKLSHPPSLVDAINVRMAFGEQTALGPAPSHIEVEAHGGFLFIHKRYKGEATLSNYRISP